MRFLIRGPPETPPGPPGAPPGPPGAPPGAPGAPPGPLSGGFSGDLGVQTDLKNALRRPSQGLKKAFFGACRACIENCTVRCF